jgi:hypothetical protein
MTTGETATNGDAPRDFDLTCWYLNQRRIFELVGADMVTPGLNRVGAHDDNLRRIAAQSLLKDALVNWIRSANPPTLGQLLISDTLAPGNVFTHYTNFYCRGLPKVADALRKGKIPVPVAEAYAKLDDFRSGWRVSCRFHHEHLTSNSSWTELSGQKPLFVLGAITSLRDATIEAIPWVIANPIPSFERPVTLIGTRWNWRLEIFLENIDSFANARDIAPVRTVKELERLRSVPEREVKAAFAEIIGEPTVPKDWGGERSDLFTSHVLIDGNRISTAFAFKGPAAFRPMTMADLGKNGDQIDRLFTEPADLLVLQHCHEITPPVRGAMRAYAQQMGNPRLFSLIDGYDTARLFRAYGKCGF